MGHTVRIISQPPRQTAARSKLKSWIKAEYSLSSHTTKSHLDGSGLDHHVLDRRRPVTDDDVPDADIVIATWWETAEWVSALSPKKGAKVYFIQHHEIFSHLPVERCKATYGLPLHKIVVARWIKQLMCKQYGDEVVDLVPNSVDRNQFFAPIRGKQYSPTAGVLYSIASFKGLDASLSALRSVRERLPQLRVISFGDHRPSKALPLPRYADFFLCPPQDQIRNLYSQCDVWVTASRSEGFNLPAMEAMACRTPVVSTRAGWPEEAVKTGINGVLVDVDDHPGLANGIEWILSRSDKDWRILSSNAFATVASSSWEASAKMFERALKRACFRASRGEIAGRCACAFESNDQAALDPPDIASPMGQD